MTHLICRRMNQKMLKTTLSGYFLPQLYAYHYRKQNNYIVSGYNAVFCIDP